MRQASWSYLAVLLVVVLAGSSARANMIDDPSFEAATSGGQVSNSNWTLTVNFPDGVNPAAQFQNAPWASNPDGLPGTGVWFRSFEGQQAAGEPAADASLQQSVAALADGDYILTFFAKREAHFTATAWTVMLSSSGTGGFDGVDLLAVAPNDGSWNQYSVDLSGVSSGDILTVSAVMTDGVDPLSNPQSAFVDDFHLVRVQDQIPEPTSIALFGLGVSGLILTLRRRRARPA